MKKRGSFFNWRKGLTISYGIAYVFFTLWVIFHIPDYFPPGTHEMWYKVLIGYGILNAIIFANADIRNKLFNVKLTEFLPRFLLFFVVFIVFFYFTLQLVDPLGAGFFDLVKSVPLWLAVIHSLVFATTESAIWQGWLDERIGVPWSSMLAGIFHLGIWSGGAVIVFLGATGLFMFFSFVHWLARKSKKDLAPVIGCHSAFNFVKLGLLVSAGGII